jgi:hypothetical protein
MNMKHLLTALIAAALILAPCAQAVSPIEGGTGSSDPTAVSSNTAGWTYYYVTSNFTTSSTSFVDITGLVTGTLAANGQYQIDAQVLIQGDVTDVNGIKLTIHAGGSGGTASVNVMSSCNTASQANASTNGINVLDAGTPAYMTYANAISSAHIRGFFTAASTSPLLSIQVLKFTAGSLTVKIGSFLRIRRIN